MSGKNRSGYYYIFLEILFWSWFPVVTAITVAKIPPLLASGASTFVAAIFFFFYVWTYQLWPKRISKKALRGLLISTFLIGIVFYILVFYAAVLTQAGNINLLLMLQILFSLVLFRKVRGESLTLIETIGCCFMLCGALLVLFPQDLNFATGDLLLLAAAFLAPFGNYFVKQARSEMSAQFIMLIRSIISGIVILICSFFIEENLPSPSLELHWAMVLINGIFLIGLSKVFWIEALHRMPIAKVASFTTITPYISLLWIYIFFGTQPGWQQIAGGLPLIVGTVLIVRNKKSLNAGIV